MTDSAVECTNPPATAQEQPKLAALVSWLRQADQRGRIGGTAVRRKIAGSDQWSVHACGRAVDWFPSSGGAGNWLFYRLVQERPHGVQRIIWQHVIATLRGGVLVFSPYTPRDHEDHLHVEVLP